MFHQHLKLLLLMYSQNPNYVLLVKKEDDFCTLIVEKILICWDF